MASSSRRKQSVDVNPEQLIKLESSPFVKHTLEGPSSSKDSNKRLKTSHDEIMIGKNHVNPALVLHIAKSKKDLGISQSKMNAIISQTLRQLKSERNLSEKAWFFSLITLAKQKPDLFTGDKIVEVLCSYLEKDQNQMSHKGRNASLMPVLSWSLLMVAFKKHEHWPEIFVKMYVLDVISDRLWVDNPLCKPYCVEIAQVFGTMKPKTSSPTSLPLQSHKSESDPIVLNEDSGESTSAESSSSKPESCSRYSNVAVKDSIREFVTKTVNDYMSNKKPIENMTRNFVKFLCLTSGYKSVRLLAASKLDQFLNSTKLSRPGQDLLSYLAANTNTGSSEDIEVVQRLSQLRIKSKPLVNFYCQCLKELLSLHSSNMEHVMRSVVFNELSANRNPLNMQLIVAVIQYDGEKAAIVLAHIFQELIVQPDDCLKQLRQLLREIVRCNHYDFKFTQFALALMQEITLPAFRTADPKLQERIFLSIQNLICLTILLSCKPSIKEIALSSTKTDVLPLIKFQNEVATMQKNAVGWLHKIVPLQYRITGKHFTNALKQVLFLDDPAVYSARDNWPSESDREMLVSLCAEVPLLENTLMRLGVLGTTHTLPIRPLEVLDIINRVIRRAAMLDTENNVPPPLQITGNLKHQFDVIETILKLSEYKCFNVKFPDNYKPPDLVIASHYWRSWLLLLILAAFNPSTVGALAWKNHPTLRGLMEMVITNNYQFPLESANYQETMLQEKQLSAAEKSDILLFEGYLAAPRGVKITMANSQFISQLMIVKNGGPFRKPPPQMLEQARLLALELRLGYRLSKSRDPDFLLEIIKQQGTSKSMSWLSELVKSSENSFELLPVQCLCEFLLQDIRTSKRHILLKRLQSILFSPKTNEQQLEIVQYFFSKISTNFQTKTKAITAMSTIINGSEDNEDWLLGRLANIPCHATLSSTICFELRKAIKVEASPKLLGTFLVYICRYTSEESKKETISDIANVIVNRHHRLIHTLLTSDEAHLGILLDYFCTYIIAEETDETDEGIHIVVNGKSKVFELMFIQATLILLAQSRGHDVGTTESVTNLKEIFFSKKSLSCLSSNWYELMASCNEFVKSDMLGCGIAQLQNLTLSTMNYRDMISTLKGFTLTASGAEAILRKLDDDIDDVIPLLGDDEELMKYVEAWRKRVTTGSKVDMFLQGKYVEVKKEPKDYYANLEEGDKMEVDVKKRKKNAKKDWSRIFQKIFEENCIESQSYLLQCCVEKKNIEEICLNLFLWVKNNTLTPKSKGWVAMFVLLISEKCSNFDLLEKLLVSLSEACKHLKVLHTKLFPTSITSTSKYDDIVEWCKSPSVDESNVKTLLAKLNAMDLDSESDLKHIGYVWQKVFKAVISNPDTQTNVMSELISIVVNKMIKSPKAVGLFMDWLPVLSPDLKCFELFLDTNRAVPVSIQRYILNYICSNSGWDTIYRCIDILLSDKNYGFDPSLILDFLQGCCNHERIWRGANSKRGTKKGSLNLDKNQLWNVCKLVMSELDSAQCERKQYIILTWRLPLILSPHHKQHLHHITCKLQHYPIPCSKLMILMLYLSRPNLFPNGPSSSLSGWIAMATVNSPASCDSLIHQLIDNVCSNKTNASSGYILLRRLAAYHPPLILRHLRLVYSAIGSRNTLSKNEFQQGDHGSMFCNIIGILEALGPQLFDHDCADLLTECLQFVTTHCKAQCRLYSPTILKFTSIFLLFLQYDRNKAMSVLTDHHIEKLRKLENKLRDPLLAKLLICVSDGTTAYVDTFDENQMAPYLTKLSSDSHDSVNILRDLETGSLRKPSVLKMFLREICVRMSSEDEEVRRLAHKLAVRHVRHEPKDSSIVVAYLEDVFLSGQSALIKTALEEVPELILLGGQEIPSLMRIIFIAVTKDKTDMLPDLMTVVRTILKSSDLF